MLRLDRLEISGFKSFYEKADLSFPGALTAIVGPNGCGKSNICDAVSWVLGEQSAKVLRGETMDDVVFNGSGKRRPLGMAEVTLTLQAGPEEFPETDGRVSIGRRVYRDGDGEYLMNGRKVRLRDVQDVLFGTGLGVRAYSIIEQGKIEQVLSSKPQERRKLIEEAAGITKYKVKKRAAELKLEETRVNLTRVADIIAEVERTCTSLKRQAAKAERYKERTAELRERRQILARRLFDRLSAEHGAESAALASLRDAETRVAASLAAAEAAEAEARRRAIDGRLRRDAAREALAAVTSTVEREDASIEAARRAEFEIASRREALRRDTAQLEDEAARRGTESLRLEALVTERRAQAERARAAKDAAVFAKQETEGRLTALEKSLDEARADLVARAGERVEARNERHEIDLALERVASSRGRIEEMRSRVTASLASLAGELARGREESDRLAAENTARRESAQENDRRAAEVAAEVAALEHRRGDLREELAALEHRAAALEEIRAGRERDAEAARAALAQAGHAVSGFLAEALRPRAGWEEVLDRLAAEELSALVVDDESRAAAGRLREAGIAGTVAGNRWTGASPTADWASALENWNELPPAIAASLPRVTFVETANDAAAGAAARPHELFAARTGEIVRGALWRVPGGACAKEGALTLRRDVDDARQRHAGVQEQLVGCEESLSRARALRAEREAEAATLAQAWREAESASAAHAARQAERQQEEHRKSQELSTLEQEDAMLAADGASLAGRRSEVLAREAVMELSETQARELADALSTRIAECRPQAAAAAEAEAARRVELEGARERLSAAERERETVAAQNELATRKRVESAREAQELGSRQETARHEAEQARLRRDESLRAREAAAREFESLSSESETLASSAAATEEVVRQVRESHDEARQRRFDAEIRHSRLEADLGHAVADATHEFGVPPAQLPPVPEASEEESRRLEEEARELSEQIERMGPVNVLAFEEHREQSERLTFLTTQRQDLEGSIASLLETIRKINSTSSERFAEAFAAINAHFSELFQRLFGGGAAEMRLLDENDLLDSGIEITAQPPGKRNQSILLLSGGEKAMTAIALLMGIFRYKPSPFCILDEVDAPLDEANIDRFTRLVREMSEDTQFIAITHNKRTMETADALYGVTMEEPGCSKIVSVRLD
jgi:chromosome segregation protein